MNVLCRTHTISMTESSRVALTGSLFQSHTYSCDGFNVGTDSNVWFVVCVGIFVTSASIPIVLATNLLLFQMVGVHFNAYTHTLNDEFLETCRSERTKNFENNTKLFENSTLTDATLDWRIFHVLRLSATYLKVLSTMEFSAFLRVLFRNMPSNCIFSIIFKEND